MSDEFDDAINSALEAESAEKKPDAAKPADDISADDIDFDAAFEEELAGELLGDDLTDDGEADEPAEDVPAVDEAPAVNLDAPADVVAAAPVPAAMPAPMVEGEDDPADQVGFELRGPLAVISLTRPQALNALTLDMTRRIAGLLRETEANDSVTAIAIWSPEGRAFCAGGDIRKLWDWGRSGRRELFHFFREEYTLNHQIASLTKPLVTLMDGIVMGGGVGLALHAPHRVVSENVAIAMPEVGIGFVPDIGSSYLLPRMPGRTGRFMALTGERIGAADAVWAGLAEAVVPRVSHDNVLDRLAEGESPEEAIDAFAVEPEASMLEARRETLDDLFAGDPQAVAEALTVYDGPHADWVGPLAEVYAERCPFSLLATHGLMERGEGAALADCLINEFRAASRAVQRQDFYEGVRAAVVDKDRRPRWRPASLAAVDADEIEALFQPSPMRDLNFA